jgi:hypothetical protein
MLPSGRKSPFLFPTLKPPFLSDGGKENGEILKRMGMNCNLLLFCFPSDPTAGSGHQFSTGGESDARAGRNGRSRRIGMGKDQLVNSPFLFIFFHYFLSHFSIG